MVVIKSEDMANHRERLRQKAKDNFFKGDNLSEKQKEFFRKIKEEEKLNKKLKEFE